MIRGSCSCGRIRFEVEKIALMSHCHCSVCRKATGAAFATWAHALAGDFHFVSGADLISKHLDSEGMGREFCARCGSLVPGKPDHMETWSIPAGILDDDPGARPVAHVFARSRACWWEISDELVQFDTWPPGMRPGSLS